MREFLDNSPWTLVIRGLVGTAVPKRRQGTWFGRSASAMPAQGRDPAFAVLVPLERCGVGPASAITDSGPG